MGSSKKFYKRIVLFSFFLPQSKNKDRKKEMDDFLAQLEAKYTNNAKKGGKKTAAKKGKK